MQSGGQSATHNYQTLEKKYISTFTHATDVKVCLPFSITAIFFPCFSFSI